MYYLKVLDTYYSDVHTRTCGKCCGDICSELMWALMKEGYVCRGGGETDAIFNSANTFDHFKDVIYRHLSNYIIKPHIEILKF